MPVAVVLADRWHDEHVQHPEPIGDRVERSYESDLVGQASPASTSQPSTPCAEDREQQQSETSRGRGRRLPKATVDQATL